MTTSVAASLTIHKPGKMSAKGRKEIVAWLRRQASNLLKHGDQYNDTGAFRARYYYPEEGKK